MGLELGATTSYLRDVLGQSKARSAEQAGISASHMTELMARAGDQGLTVEDPLQRIAATKRTHEIEDFVHRHEGIARIVASFHHPDTLYMSGVHPSRLLRRYEHSAYIYTTSLMVQAADGDWIAAAGCNVGYGGSGPDNTILLLSRLGLPEDLALSIASHRVSDVTFDGLTLVSADHSNEWPRYPVDLPDVIQDQFVAGLSVDGLLSRRTVSERGTMGGFYPVTTDRTAYEDWLALLDCTHDYPTPDWLMGDRRGRIYFDADTARADGYLLGHDRDASFILHQGDLSLWIETPYVLDKRRQLDPQMYPILRAAGFYVDDLEARDQAGAFRRWLTAQRGREPFVDLRT